MRSARCQHDSLLACLTSSRDGPICRLVQDTLVDLSMGLRASSTCQASRSLPWHVLCDGDPDDMNISSVDEQPEPGGDASGPRPTDPGRGPKRTSERSAPLGALWHDRAFGAALRSSLAVLLVVGAVWFLYLAWPIVRPL